MMFGSSDAANSSLLQMCDAPPCKYVPLENMTGIEFCGLKMSGCTLTRVKLVMTQG